MVSTPQSLLPPNEAKRLETLRAYGVQPALQEELFTKVVELAATLFNVPISLIALVEADDVAYKAAYGLPSLQSQPRVEAICSTAVKQQQTVVFTELAHTHLLAPEAASAALAKGLHFYAGTPLCMPNRQCIGTLCIVDRQPRTFSAPEQHLLEQLARLVERFVAVRQYCLADPIKSESYWGVVHAELTQEVQALLTQVQCLVGYAGTHIPVSADVLESADQRLNDLRWRLDDYHPGSL